MDRRTFVLLTGAASAGWWRSPRVLPPGGPAAGVGGLRFDLDEQRRWSLWYHDDGQPVPLVRDAVLGVWVGETLMTLADLEVISVANRRPPGGESLAIQGRTAAGVWIEAEFAAWEAGPGAQGSITVNVYPDRVLATIRGVRFFAAAEAQVLPGAGPLLALVNGYQSWSACRIETVGAQPDVPEAVSHAAIGLTREGRGLAVAFDAGEPGEAKVKLAAGGLEALSDWLPARPVRSEGDGSTMRLAYLPDGDGLAALGALATPVSAVDRERFDQVTAPTGWCSWYELGGAVTEADVLANLEFCAAHFDRRFFRYIQLDDGYQRAAGDWETNAKFPRGHRWLTDRIHAQGFLAGLWIAPFAAAERSSLPAAHAAWLLRDPDGGGTPLVLDTRDDWGGRIYALDGAHPEVRQWLYDLARRVVRNWGYDYLKVDFLHWATAGAAHYGGLTHAEAYRGGLAALRDGLGTEAFLLGCGAPLQHAAGLVDGMRIGGDVDASWGGIQGPARAAGLRSFYHRAVWLNDPDCLVVRPPLTLDEARVWTSIVAAAGGVTVLSDNLPKLPPERIPLLQQTLPVALPVPGGGPVGTQVEEREVAPAVVAGDEVVRLHGPWRFRTGDDARYAARDYDDDAWETLPVPQIWERAGHPDYDGQAWYRTRFTLPPAAGDRAVVLELGKVDDADETFVNGVKVGETRGWLAYRRYPVPANSLNWGGENVLAIRVTDGGGAGGLWSVRRDRPAATWVVEGAPRWWTVVLVNWEEEPQAVAHALATLGISGTARFLAYDVWARHPLADVQQTLQATIAPHGTLTVALRAAAAHPQVIGTTRHVIQGAIDIAEERWDAATRTLAVKSVRLDGRVYAVMVAVPRGLRPGVCKADAPCTVRRLESGHAVIEWPAGTSQDVSWSLSFRSVPAARSRR
jgi:alpha-galactosidase